LENALKNKITIEHFTRQFIRDDFENYDYIIAMDKNNHANILSLLPFKNDHYDKVKYMRSFETDAEEILDVPDPYFGGEKGFQEVYEILHRTCLNLLHYIREKHNL
jgi:protein-tyrosine phosphatase